MRDDNLVENYPMKIVLFFWALLLVNLFASEENLSPIPYKQDPPIQVDGELADWHDVPISYVMDTAQQICWEDTNFDGWKGPSDLSGKVMLCWKEHGLYLAADVMDDCLIQKKGGDELFLGDHVELFLDVSPLFLEDHAFGAGQFHLGISPGDLESLPAEIFCFFPKKHRLGGAACVSARTGQGWLVEAYLPWEALGLPRVRPKGTALNFVVWISDTDSDNELQQKQIMSIGPIPWEFRSREGMRRGILANADGLIEGDPYAVLEPIELFREETFPPGSSQKFSVKMSETPFGAIPVLKFQARLHSERLNGYTDALAINVNGKMMTGEQLVNRPLHVETKQGVSTSFYRTNGFVVPYTGAGDFLSGNRPGTWVQWFKQHVNLHDFELDLSFAIKEEENSIVFFNKHEKSELILRNAEIFFRLPPVLQKPRPAPTGPLPVFHLKEKHSFDDIVISAENPLHVALGEKRWTVKSVFSTPDGKWVTGANAYFGHFRRIGKKAEAVIVEDVFTNLTDDPLPLMQRHEIPIAGEDVRFFINGLEAIPSNGKSRSFNSSSFAGTKDGGIGMFPLNMEFQIHAENYISGENTIGLCDEQFVLPSRGSFAQRFVVIPVASGDYWDFLNALRRLIGSNFRLDGVVGSFAAVNHQRQWSDEQLKSRCETRNANILLLNTWAMLPHGSLFETSGNLALVEEALQRLRRLFPGKKILLYLHTQIEPTKDAEELFPEACVLYKNGKGAYYGNPDVKLFFCQEGNSYAKMAEAKIERLMKLDIDGFFWDEMSASGTPWHYGKPWDGCSGDISRKTHRLERLKSSVALLQTQWQMKMLDRMKQQGKIVVVNGATYGPGQTHRLPAVAETAQISNCAKTHIWTPLQWADYTNHRHTQVDFYLDMLRGLDYGCLFTGWNLATPHQISGKPDDTEDYHTLTDHMYPFTPVELHKGYIIGKERILTKVSGLFGWGDDSVHEVHVYDEYGREQKDAKAPQINQNGNNYTELRLAEDWSAAIIRKKFPE